MDTEDTGLLLRSLSKLGTLRVCIDCGCVVAGGPTRCVRCAKEGKPRTPILDAAREQIAFRWRLFWASKRGIAIGKFLAHFRTRA